MQPATSRRLVDLATVIRSKNAGPTLLTLDLFFRDADAYAIAAQSPALQIAAVAQRYGVESGEVSRYLLPRLNAMKFSLPRLVCAGGEGDGDVYGAQQHGPLLSISL